MEKDFGKIPKNDATDIVIRVDDFGGKKGLTIREHITTDRYTGFTKAGTRIPAEHFLKFREIINSIPLEDMKEEPAESDGENLNNQTRLSNSGKNNAQKEDLPDY